MPGQQQLCVICTPDATQSIAYTNCTLPAYIRPRDSECAICLMPFNAEELLVMHNECERVWHESCIANWVRSTRGDHNRNVDTQCPMCKRLISTFRRPKQSTLFLTIADDSTLSRLPTIAHPNTEIMFEDRAQLADHLRSMFADQPQLSPFLEANMTPRDDGSYPSFDIPSNPQPGTELFRGATSVQAGALRFFCGHRTEIILLTAKQVYEFMPVLYMRGWTPASQQILQWPQVSRGMNLSQIIEQAKLVCTSLTIVDDLQMALLFPECKPLQEDLRLILCVERMSEGHENRFKVAVCAIVVGRPGCPYYSPQSREMILPVLEQIGGDPSQITVIEGDMGITCYDDFNRSFD